MASVLVPFTLCTFPSQQRLRDAISRGPNDDLVIVTGHQNTVSVYKVDDRQVVYCWTERQALNLTTRAVYDPFGQNYVIAINETTVWRWTQDFTKIEHSKKVKARFPVQEIMTSPESAPYLVYNNGFVECLNSVSAPLPPDIDCNVLSKNDIILQCDMLVTEAKTLILMVCHKLKRKSIATCHLVSYSNNGVYSHSSKKFHQKGLTLVSCSLYKTATLISAFFLWSDGSVKKFNVMSTTTSFEDIEPFDITQMEKFTDQKVLGIAGLNDDHIAITAANMGHLSPVSGGVIVEVMVVNIKFQTIHSRGKIKLSSSQQFLQFGMHYFGQKLYLVTASEVVVVPTEVSVYSLSSVLGTNQSKVQNSPNFMEWESGITLKWTEQGLEKCQPVKGCNIAKYDETISDELAEQLQKIEKSGVTNAIVCAQVLEELTQMGNAPLILEALSYFQFVPESALVGVLHYHLSRMLKANDFTNVDDAYHENPLINRIISIPANDIFLVEHLRNLPFAEVKLMLRYLHQLLKHHKLVHNSVPNAGYVIDWLCMLMDAHYQNLVLTKESTILAWVNDLTITINEKGHILKEAGRLENLIMALMRKSALEKARKPYSIETLHIT